MGSINFFHDLIHSLTCWELLCARMTGVLGKWHGVYIPGASLRIGTVNTKDPSVNRQLVVSLLPGT